MFTNFTQRSFGINELAFSTVQITMSTLLPITSVQYKINVINHTCFAVLSRLLIKLFEIVGKLIGTTHDTFNVVFCIF